MKKTAKAIFLIFAFAILMIVPYNINYLNIMLYNSAIDSTNYGWEVKRNNNHKQPDIPDNALEIIKKY